jgi:sRNA-binding regulator protein Hfq
MTEDRRSQPIYQRPGNGKPKPPSAAPKIPTSANDPWYLRAGDDRAPIDVHLLNGDIWRAALVTSVTRFAIVVKVDGQERCLQKHAISWSARSVK